MSLEAISNIDPQTSFRTVFQNRARIGPRFLSYFGLKYHPFLLTVDSHFLYPTGAHQRGLSHVNYALSTPPCLVLLTGETGVGKTMLLQDVLANIEPDTLVANIHNSQLREDEFMRAVSLELGLKSYKADKTGLLGMLKLNEFLIQKHAEGRKIVLAIDDAHMLTPQLCEEIRMLMGLGRGKNKIVSVILAGQSPLHDRMGTPAPHELMQRVRLCLHLDRLGEEETGNYIQNRLLAGGCTNMELFGTQVVRLIHRFTGGIPKLINVVCEVAMTMALAEEAHTITIDMVDHAMRQLHLRPYHEPPADVFQQRAESLKEKLATPLADTGGNLNGRLIYTHRDNLVAEFPLNGDRVKIGRASNCQVRISDTHISRFHAEIYCEDTGMWIEDLGSTNGTLVNGLAVARQELRTGDIVNIGDHRLKYVDKPAPSDLPKPGVAAISTEQPPIISSLAQTDRVAPSTLRLQ